MQLCCLVQRLFSPEHTPDSDNDKWNAEQLPHVQKHTLFKFHLLFLQELDKEAEREDSREAETEVEACADSDGRRGEHRLILVPTPIKNAASNKDDEIGNSFV